MGKIIVLLVVGAVVWGVGNIQADTTYHIVEFEVCTASGEQSDPVISGDIVVWEDQRNGNRDIYGYNLATQSEFSVVRNSNAQQTPAISGDTVVWYESPDLHGYNLSTQEYYAVGSQSGAAAELPDVSGNIVVWEDHRRRNHDNHTVMDIWGYDLATQREFLVYQDDNVLHDSSSPAIDGSFVVWHTGGDNSIYGKNLVTEQVLTITSSGLFPRFADISGNSIVWQVDLDGTSDIYGYDLNTQMEFGIATGIGNQSLPSISGNFIVWQDERNGNWDIYGYDLRTQTEFAIATGSGDQLNPAISGNIVVWEDSGDIYGARITREGPVYFADENLKAAVEEALGISDPNEAEMLGLTSLTAGSREISDLTGIEYATNLTLLNLDRNQITDISALSGLIDLTVLTLIQNQISDISVLSELTSLVHLDFFRNQITDLSPLSDLTNLTWLRVAHGQVEDISPLSDLTNLTSLSLQYNQISNISALSNLTNLTSLQLQRNYLITDIAALSDLTNLTRLELWDNQISDVNALSNLTELTHLNIGNTATGHNEIEDISVLSRLTNLTYLAVANPINNISPLAELTNLTWLALTYNEITDISPLSELTNLSTLQLNYNNISDISVLSNFHNLAYLRLEGNPLDCLAFCIHIPNIEVNNPGIELWFDPMPDHCDCDTVLANIITVLSPNGSENLVSETAHLITWDVNPQIQIENIIIELSSDNGENWEIIDTVENTGSYEWTIPVINSNQCLIRITDTENSLINDTSDAVFTIFECDPPIPGDANGDCYLNLADVAIVALNWLKCGNPFDPLCGDDPKFVGHWNFNEEEGDTAYDSSGYENDGNLINGPVWTGEALNFDGIDDYVEVPDSESLRFNNQLAISVWAYLNAYGTDWPKVVIKPHSEYSDPWEMFTIDLSHYGTYPRFIITNGIAGGESANASDDTYTLSLNQWYNIVGTYDGSTIALYVDGQLVAFEPANIVIGQNDMPISIGGRLGINSFNGLIDEVRIYSRALSESEIEDLHQNH